MHRPKSPGSSSLVALSCDVNMSHVTEVHVLETKLILRTKMLKMACLYASLPLQRPQWLSTVFTTEVLTMDMGSVSTFFCKHSLACYSFIYRMMIKEASLKTLDFGLHSCQRYNNMSLFFMKPLQLRHCLNSTKQADMLR